MNDLCQIEREIFFVFAVIWTTIKFFTLPIRRLVLLDKTNLKFNANGASQKL